METLKTKDTLRFGLAGCPVGHSVSPELHRLLFEVKGVRAEYRLFDIPPEQLPAKAAQLLALDGCNITIPHKQTIIPFLSGLSEQARRFGAVNTLYRGRGYNTDVDGFSRSLSALCGENLPDRALVLGSGGTASMMTGHLLDRGLSVTVAVRDPSSRSAQALAARYPGRVTVLPLAEIHGGFPLVCNATPCGMHPHRDEVPLTQQALNGVQFLFDAIYNPCETLLAKQAKALGAQVKCGMTMLVYQAASAQEQWLDTAFTDGELAPVVREMELLTSAKYEAEGRPILLSGFMGSGKTYYGRRLARSLGLPFIDVDQEITAAAKKSIPELFATRGEEGFRLLERETVLRLLNQPGQAVMALGGGALHHADNAARFREKGYLIFVDTPFETCLSRIEGDTNRPNAAGDVRGLYERRLPLYRQAAHYCFRP